MSRVFVTRALPQGAMDRLRAEAGEVVLNPHDRPVTREELLDGVRGATCLLSQLVDSVDDDVLTAGEGLRLVANYAVGFNNVDVAAATRRGILVSNTPGVLTETTADLTFALLLAVARRVVESDRFLRDGKYEGWAPLLLLGDDVHGKTLGIVGLGRIGRAVARRARGFGMRVLYAGPAEQDDAEGATFASLDELLAESDFVSLHVPLNDATHHLIDAAALKRMKPSAYLLNVARGPIVDEQALVAALRAGEIAGAGLDVFEGEPAVEPGLVELDNVVLVPHVGSATKETRLAMANIAVDNVLDVLAGRPPRSCVNPEASANER